MFTIKKRNPMQFLYKLTAMILIMLLLVSYGKSIPSGEDKPDSKGKPEVTAQQDEQKDASPEQQDEVSNESGPPSTAGQSLGAYLEAKSELVSILSDALSTNPGTELDSMSFLGIAMVDLALVPASCFGLGQDVAIATLGTLGAGDVEYSESGNQYSVKYRSAESKQCELQGEYDKAADALKCISKMDGKEGLIMEYRKTSFGYVGQIYAINEDGSTHVYQLAVSGKDGAVGISKESAAPPELTGSETIDFPKQCQEWYAIEGDAVTGVTSDGREISFVYTPSEDRE
jgi:hypothetical protein